MADYEGIWTRGGVNVEDLPDPFALPPEPPDNTPEAGEEEPESDLPTAPAAGAATRRPNGNGAAGNTAGEGV